MVSVATSPGSRLLGPALCIVVLLIMIIAVLYAAWISVSNFANIGV